MFTVFDTSDNNTNPPHSSEWSQQLQPIESYCVFFFSLHLQKFKTRTQIMQPAQPDPYYVPPTTAGTATAAPTVAPAAETGGKKRSIKETVSKYIEDIKADFQRHKANRKEKKAGTDATRAQEQGDLPQYSIYGIGTQPTQAEVDAHREAEMRAQAAEGPARLVYPTIVPIDTIRVPLDSSGQPLLDKIALKYDNLSKTYNAAIVENPALCQLPTSGERTHEFATLPRYVQFRAKDTLGRDIMLYSNTYCRACGVHSLVLKM